MQKCVSGNIQKNWRNVGRDVMAAEVTTFNGTRLNKIVFILIKFLLQKFGLLWTHLVLNSLGKALMGTE